jgi:hypothetical protein
MRSTTTRRRPLIGGLVSLALLLAACTVEDPGSEYTRGGLEADASVPSGLEPPRLSTAIPARTPLASVALRGTATGSRIIVKGGATGTLVKLPLPTGEFCIDLPLNPGASTKVAVHTLDSGLVSLPAEHVVVQDPTAPKPQNPYCEPPACAGQCPASESACADGKDDDLDGWTDDCDPDCNGCVDDAFEPNSVPAAVPLLSYDRTEVLMLCPCHDDWLAVFIEADKTLEVQLTAAEPGLEVHMKLFRPEDAEKDGYKTAAALGAATSADPEKHLSWKADETGMYYLRVYAPDSKGSGEYQLWASVGQVKE